jgi:putative transcriptional regulator
VRKKKQKAVDMIADGLKDAIAIARGELEPARIHVPDEIDVRRIRNELAYSQEKFASTYGFTLTQVREWEQGRCQPTGAVRAYLIVIGRDPTGVAKLLQTPAASSAPIKRLAASRARR